MKRFLIFRPYLYFILGLFIISIGICLAAKAGLGVSPVSSIPYTLSLALPLTLGQITILIQSVYLILQILIRRKNFPPIQFLQIVVVFLFGYLNDFSMMLLTPLTVRHYAMRWVFCLMGLLLLALGVCIEVRAGVLMLAVDALVAAISEVYHLEFSRVKITFDCIQVGIAILCSFLLMHRLEGSREGTIAAAILVGVFIKGYNKYLGPLFDRIGLSAPPPKEG